MVKKEETIAEREERQHNEKEATAKIFVDLQLRALEVEEALVKSKVLEAEAKIMAEENRIMLTDLATITDAVQRAWIEKRQKMILARED